MVTHRSLAVSLIVLAAGGLSASAGVTRHDRSQADYLALGALGDYSSVGQIQFTTPAGGYLGSGTLIAEDWVLTAAHVVDDATALTFTLGGTTYTGASWLPYPKWNGDLLAGYDIGLVKLAEPVAGVTPATRYAGSDEAGAVGTAVGYGMTGTGLTGATTYDGEKRAGENVIDGFYARNPRKEPTLFLSDFDNPLNAGDNVYGSADPLDLEYLIAFGDSGGGVFIDLGFGLELAGVNSFIASFDGTTDADYGDVAGFTRVSAFNQWIDDILGGGGKGGKGGGKPGGDKPGKGGGKPTDLLIDCDLTAPGVSIQPMFIPEPVSLTLLALGGGLLALRRRR